MLPAPLSPPCAADFHPFLASLNLPPPPRATPALLPKLRSVFTKNLSSESGFLCFISLPGITSQTAEAVPSIPEGEQQRSSAARCPHAAPASGSAGASTSQAPTPGRASPSLPTGELASPAPARRACALSAARPRPGGASRSRRGWWADSGPGPGRAGDRQAATPPVKTFPRCLGDAALSLFHGARKLSSTGRSRGRLGRDPSWLRTPRWPRLLPPASLLRFPDLAKENRTAS